jgi:hypothetical protein
MKDYTEIIKEEEYFSTIPDCIFEANDYEEIIIESFRITQGVLNLESFEVTDHESTFEFKLVVNNKPENLVVNVISDYVDGDSIILGLNKILENNNYKGDKFFCDLMGPIFDVGIAFITKQKEKELAENEIISREL